jgi:hypothetical protein
MLKVLFIKNSSNIYKGRILSASAAGATFLILCTYKVISHLVLLLNSGGITMMIILSLLYTNVLSHSVCHPFVYTVHMPRYQIVQLYRYCAIPVS